MSHSTHVICLSPQAKRYVLILIILLIPLTCLKTLVLFFAHRPYDLFCSNASLTPIISESIPRLAELEYNINHHYESLTTTSPTVTQSGTDLIETVHVTQSRGIHGRKIVVRML